MASDGSKMLPDAPKMLPGAPRWLITTPGLHRQDFAARITQPGLRYHDITQAGCRQDEAARITLAGIIQPG